MLRIAVIRIDSFAPNTANCHNLPRRCMTYLARVGQPTYDITNSHEARSNTDKSNPGRQQKRHQAVIVIPSQTHATQRQP